MQFSTAIAGLVAAASAAQAATVTFWTLDNVKRTIHFDSDPAFPTIPEIQVDNTKNTTVTFPDHYIGNFYAVAEGAEHKPGMLGELMFGGWQGLTYFDVSQIVNPLDKNGVKQMWPKDALAPMSGCENFPCNDVYVLPDDVQTKATKAVDLWTTLGSGSTGLNLVAKA